MSRLQFITHLRQRKCTVDHIQDGGCRHFVLRNNYTIYSLLDQISTKLVKCYDIVWEYLQLPQFKNGVVNILHIHKSLPFINHWTNLIQIWWNLKRFCRTRLWHRKWLRENIRKVASAILNITLWECWDASAENISDNKNADVARSKMAAFDYCAAIMCLLDAWPRSIIFVADDITTEEMMSIITTPATTLLTVDTSTVFYTDFLTTAERTNERTLTDDLSTTQSTSIPVNTLTKGNNSLR